MFTTIYLIIACLFIATLYWFWEYWKLFREEGFLEGVLGLIIAIAVGLIWPVFIGAVIIVASVKIAKEV